jgi:integrase
MMRRNWKERTCVYLVTAGQGFTPNSPWDFPPDVTGGSVLARNVCLSDARANVRTFNAEAMRRREADPKAWDRHWALPVCCARAKGWDADESCKERVEVPRHPRCYSDDEIARLLAACDLAPLPIVEGSTSGEWWRTFLRTLLATAMRPSVVLEIEPGDLDRRIGEPSIHASKHGGVTLPEEARGILRDYVAKTRRTEGPILAWPHGRATLYLTFQGLLDAAGIDTHRGLNGLRRTVAMRLWASRQTRGGVA